MRPLALAALGLLPGCAARTPTPPAPLAEMPVWRADPERRIPNPQRSGACMDAELADVDGDGTLDVVLAMEGPANAVLLNDGSGRFQAMEGPFVEPSDSEHAQVGDLDGDGRPDLFFANEDLGGADELYLATGSGFADHSDSLPGPATSNAAAVVDLDGDGWLDIFRGNAGQSTWWRGSPVGFVDATDRLPLDPAVTQDVAVGDLDGDGDLDLVLGNETDDVVWLQTADGFTEGPTLPRRSGETREVGLGDVDGDGDLDLVLARVSWTGRSPQSKLLLNDGTATFHYVEGALPDDPLDTLDLDFADLDGDGDPDLLGAHSSHANGALLEEGYTVWENRAGQFVDVTATAMPDQPVGLGLDIEHGDLDGDGVLDLYLCSRGSADRVLFGSAR